MGKSIFDIERRFDFNKEYKRLLNLLNSQIYSYKVNQYISSKNNFWDICNHFFLDWKYRLSALNINQYFEDIDITFETLEYCNEKQKIYVLQFIDSFICYLIDSKSISSHLNVNDEIYKPYIAITKNIGYIIEKLNFKREISNNCVTYIKRDSDVDSILTIIANENDLRLALLEYNDFRIESNKDEKKKLIIKIGHYVELHKKEFQEKNNNLYRQISNILNNYNIRHSNDKQINVRDCDIISVYDICFKMMIHLIRESYIKNSYEVLLDTYQPTK